jgi:hypothetical protein
MTAKKMKDILSSKFDKNQNIAYIYSSHVDRKYKRKKSNKYLSVAVAFFFMAIVMFVIGVAIILSEESISTYESSTSPSTELLELLFLINENSPKR